MINLNETRNFMEVLAKAETQNERVFIILDNGKEYFGKVKRSADVNYFTLREIVDKEYYDVIFRVDRITAIEVKGREK